MLWTGVSNITITDIFNRVFIYVFGSILVNYMIIGGSLWGCEDRRVIVSFAITGMMTQIQLLNIVLFLDSDKSSMTPVRMTLNTFAKIVNTRRKYIRWLELIYCHVIQPITIGLYICILVSFLNHDAYIHACVFAGVFSVREWLVSFIHQKMLSSKYQVMYGNKQLNLSIRSIIFQLSNLQTEFILYHRWKRLEYEDDWMRWFDYWY